MAILPLRLKQEMSLAGHLKVAMTLKVEATEQSTQGTYVHKEKIHLRSWQKHLFSRKYNDHLTWPTDKSPLGIA